MQIKLTKKPKNPTIIDGFPGFGMVGTIATEFLIDHLETEQIGKIFFEEMPAIVAIHEGNLVEPFGVFYNKKYNLVIVHTIGGLKGTEWKICDAIQQLAHDLGAKEIISLEGVGSTTATEEPDTFYFTSSASRKNKLKKIKLEQLKEGIIMGVTSALLLKEENIPIVCLFAETHTNLPDSKAAANIIKALDAYLGLKVDYVPLLDMAKKFESKLKSILQQSKVATQQRDKKAMSYVG